MTTTRASRDQIISRSQTHIMKEAVAAAGKGSVLSKAEQEKLESDVLRAAAREMRGAGGKGAVVSVEPWVDAAVAKVIGAVDKVDKPGKGHGTISRAEAREAVAAQGDAGARIGRAWELLTGKSLETGGAASPELTAAVHALVGEKRFGVLAGLGGGEPIAWVQKKIEDTLDGWGDGLMTQGRIKVGGQTVHVATALTWERKQLVEMIGFFDNDGRVLGRAFIERNEDTFALKFRAANADGSRGAVLASVPEAPAAPPAALVAALEAEMQKKFDDGDDLGKSVGASVLPATLAPMYAFMERNTPDGVGLERITFEGETFFAIHDYSCVSSVAVYTPGGEQLFNFVS